jgi:formylmethanofuran dehydrogenase subunit E
MLLTLLAVYAYGKKRGRETFEEKPKKKTKIDMTARCTKCNGMRIAHDRPYSASPLCPQRRN